MSKNVKLLTKIAKANKAASVAKVVEGPEFIPRTSKKKEHCAGGPNTSSFYGGLCWEMGSCVINFWRPGCMSSVPHVGQGKSGAFGGQTEAIVFVDLGACGSARPC
jgi:hypothetical protein